MAGPQMEGAWALKSLGEAPPTNQKNPIMNPMRT